MFSCSVLVYHPNMFSINQTIFLKFNVAFDYVRPYQVLLSPFQNRYRVSFPGVKRRGGDVDHLPLSSAEVKERVDIKLYSPLGLHGLL